MTPAPPNVVASFTAAVGEVPARVLIGQVAAGPLVHLRGQRGQLLQPQPRRRGGQEDLVGVVPVLLRQLVSPQADQPAVADSETCPAASAATTRGWRADPLGPRGMRRPRRPW